MKPLRRKLLVMLFMVVAITVDQVVIAGAVENVVMAVWIVKVLLRHWLRLSGAG